MVPKGLAWIILGLVTVSVILLLALFVTRKDEWCDSRLEVGDCKKYIDHSCFCIEEGSENQENQLGLFEIAQSICEDRNGMLATPERKELLIWLSKRMFFMGVDVAFIGLRKIDSTWYWTKSGVDQVPAQNVIWRPDFPEVHGQTYGMITVETMDKGIYDEEYYNYDRYAEKDETYQWFGIRSSDNTDNRSRGVYHICHYVSKPEAPKPEDTAPIAEIERDPCQCPENADLILEELGQSATFTSPRYPAGYCSDTSCRWTVTTPEDLVVKLEWIAFNLDEDRDFVNIYDGEENDQMESELLDACSGSHCNHQLSSDSAMHVHFSSDHANATDLGFKFRVTAVDPDPCYCSASSLVEMSYFGESYTLFSPNYPYPHCGNIIHNCSWTVLAPKGYGLELLWKTTEEKDLTKPKPESTPDAVRLYDGNSTEEEELTKCSKQPCDNVISTGESLLIKFLTDGIDSPTDEPFSAVITVVRNYCEKSKLESPDMLGTVSYSQTREDNNIPIGSVATLTCANSTKIDKTLDQVQDAVTCKSPDNWDNQLKICKEACLVNISLSYDHVPFNNMSLCKFKMDRMTGLVTDGDTVEVTQKDFIRDKFLSPPVEHTCKGMEWTNGKPNCHINGIIIIGGEDEGDGLDAIDLYSPALNLLIPLQVSLKTRRFSHGSTFLANDHKVIVVGGRNPRDKTMGSTEIIDLVNGEVADGPDLMEARERMAITIFNSRTVVCGGFDHTSGIGYHSSCEILEYDGNEWSQFPPMNTPRSDFGLVVLDGCLHAVGGSTGLDLSSMERFCSKNWEMMADMNKARSSHGTAVLDRMIVVCGGYRLWDDKSDCEKYLPEQDLWQSMAQMNEERVYFIMVVYGGKLFALGGWKNEYDAFEEEYEMNNDKWIIKNSNTIYKAYSSAVVIG